MDVLRWTWIRCSGSLQKFHIQEWIILWSFQYSEKHNLKVISVDKEKLQVGCSVKQLSQDPFEHIENYELNKVYKAKVVKIMDFGAFCELETGLTALLPQVS